MIFHDYTTTGDGIISALQILRIMVETGKPLSELKKCMKKYPQAQRSVKVRNKPPLGELHEVSRLKAEAETELSSNGRVVLRYSGTEPKLRLTIDGPDAGRINALADRIAEAIQREIGAA